MKEQLYHLWCQKLKSQPRASCNRDSVWLLLPPRAGKLLFLVKRSAQNTIHLKLCWRAVSKAKLWKNLIQSWTPGKSWSFIMLGASSYKCCPKWVVATSARIFSQKNTGRGCPGRWWSQWPWKCARSNMTWHSVLWAFWQGGDQPQAGLDGLGNLFQPKCWILPSNSLFVLLSGSQEEQLPVYLVTRSVSLICFEGSLSSVSKPLVIITSIAWHMGSNV